MASAGSDNEQDYGTRERESKAWVGSILDPNSRESRTISPSLPKSAAILLIIPITATYSVCN